MSGSGDGLAAFLGARLDEAKAGAWAVHDVARCDALLYEEDMPGAAARTPDCDCGYPARVLREVEAKRAILAQWQAQPPGSPVLVNTLYQLAAVDSDHPDYRQEWRP